MDLESELFKKKRSYPSPAQKARLIALIEADKELQQGKFSSSFTKKEAERRWKEIAVEINCISGTQKAWTEWRKTWQDMKSAAKKKHTIIRQATHSTGGGPPAPPLSQDDLSILRSMPQSILVGHTDSREALLLVSFSKIWAIILDLTWSSPSHQESAMQLHPTSSSASIADTSSTMAIQDRDRNKVLPTSTSAPLVLPASTSALSEQLPGSTSALAEEQAPLSAHATTAVHTGTNEDKENRSSRKKKTVGRKRLEKSMAVAADFSNHFKEELEMKKLFYVNLLKEMRRQTNILMTISNNLSIQQNTFTQEIEVETLDPEYS